MQDIAWKSWALLVKEFRKQLFFFHYKEWLLCTFYGNMFKRGICLKRSIEIINTKNVLGDTVS